MKKIISKNRAVQIRKHHAASNDQTSHPHGNHVGGVRCIMLRADDTNTNAPAGHPTTRQRQALMPRQELTPSKHKCPECLYLSEN